MSALPTSVGLIWAQARGGVIGAGGAIPWHLPEDLRHFREVTGRAAVVMGRKTWDSLPERFRPLPGRRNIVITRDPAWQAEGAERVHSLAEALEVAASSSNADSDSDSDSDFSSSPRSGMTSSSDPDTTGVWVIGGGEIYRQALAEADRLEITEVDVEVDGDTLAPDVDEGWVRHVDPERGWHVGESGIRYRFVTLARSRGQSRE